MRADGQRVDVGFHQRAQGGVDRAMTRQRGHSREALADHVHVEMAATIARSGMACMAMAVVFDLKHAGSQRLLQRVTNLLDPFRVHGSTLRNGRTCTRT